jgi:hypothetical protein
LAGAGAFDSRDGGGERARQISNASFATMSMMHSFTEVLDLGVTLSALAGLTARLSLLRQVGQLDIIVTFLDVLHAIHPGGTCRRWRAAGRWTWMDAISCAKQGP